MKFWALLDIVKVPVPLRVTLELPIFSSVVLPVEAIVMLPLFVMLVPSTVRTKAFLRVQLSAALTVMLLMVAETSSRTDEAEPVPVISTSVLLLGSPADQLPALFQLPPPAEFVKVSAVAGGVLRFGVEPEGWLVGKGSRAGRAATICEGAPKKTR